MRQILRSMLGVVVGVLVACILIAAIEAVSHLIYPPPPGIDLSDPQALKTLMANAPTGALLMVLLAWAVGTLVGAGVAARLAGYAPLAHGLVIGVLGLAAGIANMLMIPHPLWMWIIGVALFLPAAIQGARWATPGQNPPAQPASTV